MYTYFTFVYKYCIVDEQRVCRKKLKFFLYAYLLGDELLGFLFYNIIKGFNNITIPRLIVIYIIIPVISRVYII